MQVRDVAAGPTLAPLFVRAALTTRGRGGPLPEVAVRRRGVVVDRGHLLRYQRCCGFGGSDALPHSYPHVLGFPLQVQLMTDRAFPLPLPGLVHLENEVTVHRRLTADDRLDVTVHAQALQPHPKGATVDLVTEVEVGGRLAWEGRSTYLHRGRPDPSAPARSAGPELPAGAAAAVVRVPGDQGRRYASVSGDVNPIHLHRLTARLMGFPRAIAHGMWTYARALSLLGDATAAPSRSQVWFAKPVLLPSVVELVADGYLGDPGGVTLGMRSARDPGVRHLVLRVTSS